MEDKEIDNMFFKMYGYDLLPNQYKEAARKTSAYAGFRLYIKIKKFINMVPVILKLKKEPKDGKVIIK